MTARAVSTTDQLLAALRRHTSIDRLRWATPPQPLTGGFWAEMHTIELADAPPHLTGRLVARIMPERAIASYETAVQRHVHHHGLPVPAIRAASGPSAELDRAWILMDHAPGHPLLTGLSASTAIRHASAITRQLPDVLAEAAARLHRCPIDGHYLDEHHERSDIHALLHRIALQAHTVGRDDLGALARQLANHAPTARVICHGDLHPFNLLVDNEQWTLIDWSAAVITDPHYDLAFTTLLLANPPLSGPAPLRAVAHVIGSRLARRFLRTYAQRTGTTVDPARLQWGRRVHALRALVEVATWHREERIEELRGHPWLELRPTLEAELGAPST